VPGGAGPIVRQTKIIGTGRNMESKVPEPTIMNNPFMLFSWKQTLRAQSYRTDVKHCEEFGEVCMCMS
jgi:hypothetical protein